MAYLSRKDVDELKPSIDKAVQKFLGFNEPSLVTAAINCLCSGYDRRKTTGEIYLFYRIVLILVRFSVPIIH